jgi:asparagine synthase (glutamine-hydrolysing)
MLGGVPTPIPELADLVARLQVWRFLRQSFRWALAQRKPLISLWRNTLASFLPVRGQDPLDTHRHWAWLKPDFRARNREHFGFPGTRFRLFAALPSLQANAAALEVLSRQISCISVPLMPAYEWRYPFLDRDLVTFCSSLPREQLVRPNRRRSLMRRALAGTVPGEILERKRKAYVSRGLVKVLAAQWKLLRVAPLESEDAGIVDSASLSAGVARAEEGEDVPVLPLLRALALEYWLRGLTTPLVHPGIRCPVNRSGQHHAAQELLGRERPN